MKNAYKILVGISEGNRSLKDVVGMILGNLK
jgi:hypothetical protein